MGRIVVDEQLYRLTQFLSAAGLEVTSVAALEPDEAPPLVSADDIVITRYPKRFVQDAARRRYTLIGVPELTEADFVSDPPDEDEDPACLILFAIRKCLDGTAHFYFEYKKTGFFVTELG